MSLFVKKVYNMTFEPLKKIFNSLYCSVHALLNSTYPDASIS